MGPRAGLDGSGNSRIPRRFDLRTGQTVTSRYTDWAIAADAILLTVVLREYRLETILEVVGQEIKKSISFNVIWRVKFFFCGFLSKTCAVIQAMLWNITWASFEVVTAMLMAVRFFWGVTLSWSDGFPTSRRNVMPLSFKYQEVHEEGIVLGPVHLWRWKHWVRSKHRESDECCAVVIFIMTDTCPVLSCTRKLGGWEKLPWIIPSSGLLRGVSWKPTFRDHLFRQFDRSDRQVVPKRRF